MAQSSRGGGYDLARDKEAEGKKKSAFSTTSRNQVGAQASPNMVGADLQAPTSVGQLMTPSTFGQEGPPVDEADLNSRVERNRSFLSSPETRAQLMQFGISMLSGGNPGHALYQAMTVPDRMAAAQAKADENQLDIQGKELDITGKKLDIAKKMIDLAGGEKGTPTELMKLIGEADALKMAGRTEEAAMLRSRAYQLANEFSLTNGQILTPPNNAGVAPGGGAAVASSTPTISNIPGGKADVEMQAAVAKANDKKMEDIQDGMLIGAAVDGINQIASTMVAPDFQITGGLGSWMQYVPYFGQSSTNVSAYISTIKANAGFAQLQAMRDASPTGGALGQVSDFENKLLAATLASLEQSQSWDQLKTNLDTVKFIFSPTYIEARGQLSKQLAGKTITLDEATNAFNAMYREAVFGSDTTVADTASQALQGMAVPPPYVSEKMKEVWSVLTPDEKSSLLNDEDRAKLQSK